MSEAANSAMGFPAVACTQCGQPFPDEGVPHACPHCGGVFDVVRLPVFEDARMQRTEPGLWRYRHALGLPDRAPVVSLGEGNTPLIPLKDGEQTAWLKMESLNPTGSYKDRGSAVLMSVLAARGVSFAVEDSSGNAGASFAGYAARARITARVYVPESASGPKRAQIEAYGAELVAVPGPRSAAAEAVLADVRRGAVYASHAYLPFGMAGIATIAYEIWEQMNGAPGTLVAPVGHGGLLLGIMRGFAALQAGGMIDRAPYYVGVQARACAPVWEAYTGTSLVTAVASEHPTVAEGVRVSRPVRGGAMVQEMLDGGGEMRAVNEADILPAYAWLARQGAHVEPTSALAWAAFQQAKNHLPQPVVLIMSGAGLKYRITSE